jgi:hypothetical protein
MPPPRQGLGAQHRKLDGMGVPRQHPPYDPKGRVRELVEITERRSPSIVISA